MSKTLYIGGEWISAEKKQTRRIINPFNQEEIATVCEGDRNDAVKAIAAARKAFDEGEWPVLSGLERGQFVLKIAELIRRDLNELAELESLDTGKTIEESKADMDDIANVFQYYAGLADKDGGEVISSPIPDSVSKIVREPIGVCGQITPWNYPLLQASWKIAPALAAGNTIVLKPSEITPLTTIKVFQLIEEAGIPKGVANLVLGPGASVGDELARNLDVDLVSFTGGIETGKKNHAGGKRQCEKDCPGAWRQKSEYRISRCRSRNRCRSSAERRVFPCRPSLFGRVPSFGGRSHS